MALKLSTKSGQESGENIFPGVCDDNAAITLGFFFAENVRESSVEKNVTNQYLETFQQELINNKIVFNNYDSIYKNIMPAEDSIVNIFYEKKENKNLYTLGRLLAKTRRFATPL